MDKHGVGTDASMATHVGTIVERGYVGVVDVDGRPVGDEGFGGGAKGSTRAGKGGKGGRGKGGAGKDGGGKGRGDQGGASDSGTGGTGGRFMVPTALGVALIGGLGAVDTQLVRPELRASMEALVRVRVRVRAKTRARARARVRVRVRVSLT